MDKIEQTLEASIKEQADLKAEYSAIQERLKYLEETVRILQLLKNDCIPNDLKEPIRQLFSKSEAPYKPAILPLTGKKPSIASVSTESSETTPSPEKSSGKDKGKTPIVGLKPNSTGIQNQDKPVEQSTASKKLDEALLKAKNFYVVYNTDNAGIYTEWSVANSVTKGVPGVTHKKYKTYQEAKTSADMYTQSVGKRPLELLRTPPIPLVPKTYADKAKMSPQERRPKLRIEFASLNNQQFTRIWELARAASPRDMLDEKLWTRDSQTHSLFNFSQGASPNIVQQAFSAGLIHAIYPSNNLQEIKKLPKTIFDAVRDFKNHVLSRGHEDIFMEFSSILCDWVEGRYIPPVTIIKLGVLTKSFTYYPSDVMPVEYDPIQLIETRKIGYRCVLNAIAPIRLNTGWRINICQDGVLMFSKKKANIDLQDLMRVEDFERDLKLNLCDMSRDSKIAICELLQQLYTTNHACYICHQTDHVMEDNSGSDLNEGLCTPASISPTTSLGK